MTEKKLEQAKLRYVKNNLEIYSKNKDLILMYNEYINKIVELFDFIKKQDSDLFYTIVFNILVEIGFFSADRKFNTNDDDFNEIRIQPGINIVYGTGVCRNLACFYEDVFTYFYNYPLKMCCFDMHGEINDDTNIYGNHMLNLTTHQDAIYCFDLLNHCLFKAKDSNTIEGLDFDYSLEYVPNGDLLLELTTSLDSKSSFFKEVDKKRKLLEEASKKELITPEEYHKMILDANKFICDRKVILQNFMIQNKELVHEIKKKMLLL